jgi:AcrR family transcriptional regulator
MAEQASPDLLAAALALIGERGWRGFGLVELARRTGMPLATVYAELPSRGAVLRRLGARLDAAMLGVSPTELAEMTPRERLFELMMRRFDAMAPYRDALRAMAGSRGADLEAIAASLCNLQRVAVWLVDAAGGPRSGLAALAGRQAVLMVYARAFSVWLGDETEDRSKTLAELDRRLGRLEAMAGWAARCCRRREKPGAAGAEPAAA